ncbi:hypothetical protein GW793_01010 [bacterium]|uniref:Sulfatase N-terminal domain-containing protein n=2 Tax=Katanobacteria TaxID=422282 RepID=A0A2M7X0Z2_UNCKA|nr:hypothetical protein [bacterium]PIP56070.1 MAG: hypothetical protein COX05_05080 [candidate division WWE3 bacterium CG22_combo_CG10-13_8_21_14_all_39_12]PJA39843.1 MAG: hypothetical protein CO179_04230 [candidate division WWE3 bacterium CG_4_9_14_3_um_filter_39_7]
MITKYLNSTVYPFLLACVFVFAYYIQNAQEAYLSHIFLPLLIALVVTLGFYVVWMIFFRRESKAAILTAYSLIVFFLHGHIKNLLDEPSVTILGKTLGEDSLVILFWGVTGLILLWFVFKTRGEFITLTRSINTFVAVMLMVNVISFVMLYAQGTVVFIPSDSNQNSSTVREGAVDTTDLPDIYHIILDKYASNGVLKDYFNFDNSAHTDELEKMGFYVAYDARTNYPHTLYSLSTTLNMDYALQLATKLNADPAVDNGELEIIYPAFRNHEVGKLLTEAGYKYYHAANWFYPTQTSSYATENYIFNKSQFRLGEFTDKFLQQTILEPLLGKYYILSDANQHLEAIWFDFSKTKELISTKVSPKFVFTHILIPHGPYVLGADCNKLPPGTIISDTKPFYTASAECANLRSEEIAHQILESTNGNAIIIIQSDEGPNIARAEMPRDDYTFENMSDEIIRKRTEIQYAVYLPDGDYSQFSQDMTPINTYRIILNKVLGTQFPLLKDKTFITNTQGDLIKFNFNEVLPEFYKKFD